MLPSIRPLNSLLQGYSMCCTYVMYSPPSSYNVLTSTEQGCCKRNISVSLLRSSTVCRNQHIYRNKQI